MRQPERFDALKNIGVRAGSQRSEPLTLIRRQGDSRFLQRYYAKDHATIGAVADQPGRTAGEIPRRAPYLAQRRGAGQRPGTDVRHRHIARRKFLRTVREQRDAQHLPPSARTALREVLDGKVVDAHIVARSHQHTPAGPFSCAMLWRRRKLAAAQRRKFTRILTR